VKSNPKPSNDDAPPFEPNVKAAPRAKPDLKAVKARKAKQG
jgi:hypothetical protein